MTLHTQRMMLPAVALAVLALALPAQAAQRDRRAPAPQGKPQAAEPARRGGPAPRAEPTQRAAPVQRAVPRESAPPQAQVSRPSPRPQASNAPRPSVRAEASNAPRQSAPQSAPRQSAPQSRFGAPAGRGDARGNARVAPAPRSYGPSSRPGYGYNPPRIVRYYQPHYSYRPYYDFRPRIQLGFGFYVGFSVAYPSWYDPYWHDPYPRLGYYVAPGVRYGGVSFDIDPYDADVFVDGEYVGSADDFSPYEAPLTLRAGVHRIELAARGCQPMIFDITVVPGQVIPYRGALAYGR